MNIMSLDPVSWMLRPLDDLLDDLLESGGTAVKTSLDYFLEELSIMAIAGTIQHKRHYIYKDDLHSNGWIIYEFNWNK